MPFIGCKKLSEVTDEEIIFLGAIKIDTRNMMAYLYEDDIQVSANFPLYVDQVRIFIDNLLKLSSEYGPMIMLEESCEWNFKYITLKKSGYLSFRVEDRYKKEINFNDILYYANRKN